MNIAIIGAGRVGSTLGQNLSKAGHTVHYARRDPDAEVPERLAHDRATTGSAAEVVQRGDVVLVATPWPATESALSGLDFAGKPLLDVTNPIGPGLVLTHGHDDSGAEQVQRWAPTAKVVKVFNSTGRENMEQPVYPEGPSVMLACGDDEDAVRLALELARDVGFDAHAFGPLQNARLLEPFAMVWIRLAMQYGQGRGFAFRMARRDG